MKKLVLFAFFSFLTLSTFSLTAPEMINEQPEVSTEEIPQDVLSRFYGSFIVDSQGNFLGAMVGEMKEYVTMPEILTLISDVGYAVDGDKIIDRHKPRTFGGGCKYKENWICQFDDSIVD